MVIGRRQLLTVCSNYCRAGGEIRRPPVFGKENKSSLFDFYSQRSGTSFPLFLHGDIRAADNLVLHELLIVKGVKG